MDSCGVRLTWFDCKDIGMNSSVYGKANNKFAIEYGQEMNSGRNTTSILVLSPRRKRLPVFTVWTQIRLKEGLIAQSLETA